MKLEGDKEADEVEGGLDVQVPSKQEVYKATAKVCTCSYALNRGTVEN